MLQSGNLIYSQAIKNHKTSKTIPIIFPFYPFQNFKLPYNGKST